MADLTSPKADLKALQGFNPTKGTEPTEGLPPLPTQPPEQDISTGVAIARAMSIFTAGVGDPNRAAAMLQYFQAQDMAARQDAQQRYSNAVAQVQAQRQDVMYKEEVKGRRTTQNLDLGQFQLQVIKAQLDAIQLEIMATQDPGKKEHLLLTMNEMQKLLEAQQPASAKPISFKNPVEALMALSGSPRGKELETAMFEGKGSEWVQQYNQLLVENAPVPKAIFPKDMFQAIDQMEMDPAARALWKLSATQAPDPVNGPATPGEASAFASTMRQLASTSPESHANAVETYAKALYTSGQVPSMDAAYEMVAEIEAGQADPTHLVAPGTFKPKLESQPMPGLKPHPKTRLITPEAKAKRTQLRLP